MMRTRNGVYYDLNKSIYKHTCNGLTFIFSSRLHLNKFIDRQKEHRKAINASLSNRFNIMVDFPLLADIVLYRKIETRGFLVIDKEGNKLCQRHLKCGGESVTPI